MFSFEYKSVNQVTTAPDFRIGAHRDKGRCIGPDDADKHIQPGQPRPNVLMPPGAPRCNPGGMRSTQEATRLLATFHDRSPAVTKPR